MGSPPLSTFFQGEFFIQLPNLRACVDSLMVPTGHSKIIHKFSTSILLQNVTHWCTKLSYSFKFLLEVKCDTDQRLLGSC
jgi:hypothetical protein